jgi:hypothetical protein
MYTVSFKITAINLKYQRPRLEHVTDRHPKPYVLRPIALGDVMNLVR